MNPRQNPVYFGIQRSVAFIRRRKGLKKDLLVKALGVVLMVHLLAAAGLGWTGLVSHAQTPYPNKQYFPFVAKSIEIKPYDIYTTSWYMSTVDINTTYRMGCELGTRDAGLAGPQSNMLVLDFGGPRRLSSGEYGARLFITAKYVGVSAIARAVEEFGRGYYNCTGADNASNLVIGIGTNNYVWPDCADDNTCSIYQITYAHGRAWAEMVNTVNQWFVDNGYSSQVMAAGANDIELGWNDYEPTVDWLNGYDSVNYYEMINFGAIPGCPSTTALTQCGTYPYLWTREEVWYVIWGSPPVYPVPEIYAASGINARQWYQMSLYSLQYHGVPIIFRGLMTQMQACQQQNSCQGTTDNTPQEGWTQLMDLVNSNVNTAHYINWVTDIRWCFNNSCQ